MKSKSQRTSEIDLSKVPRLGTKEWVEVLYAIRKKVSHLYFYRNPEFKKLCRNIMCINYRPLIVDGVESLTDEEEGVFLNWIDFIISERITRPQFGKDEVTTLSELNADCQIGLLGEPYLHLEQMKGKPEFDMFNLTTH